MELVCNSLYLVRYFQIYIIHLTISSTDWEVELSTNWILKYIVQSLISVLLFFGFANLKC